MLEADTPPRFIVTTIQALLQPVPDRGQLAGQRRRLRVGDVVDIEELSRWLVEHRFQHMQAVEIPGEFSRRGGIVDVFSLDAEAPYRLEFFGDELESIRQFSAETQRSLGTLDGIELTANVPEQQTGSVIGSMTGHVCDYLRKQSWTILVEPDELHEQGKHYLERVDDIQGLFSLSGALAQVLRFPSINLTAMPAASVEATCHLQAESVERFSGDVTRVREELDTTAANDMVFVACHNEAEKKRLGEVLAAGKLAQSNRLRLVIGRVHAGFRMVGLARGSAGRKRHQASRTGDVRDGSAGASPSQQGSPSQGLPSQGSPSRDGSALSIVVLSDHELFHREEARVVKPRRQLEARAIDSFLDLNENDLVVHVSHGIARYRGMEVLEKNGHTEEHLIIEFREGTRVYVPVSRIELVQKYVGGSGTDPELSKLGGTSWQRKKSRVESAVLDLASDMVNLQALREAQPGIAYPSDTDWQGEFEAAFPYEETPDQLTTAAEIKRDMERTRPMDRLVCGDVGYGKTELAIRAAFKAIDNGRQVAVLVPTTVLAEQHYRTFSQRLAEYPFVVEGISRFRTSGEQRGILKRLAAGGIDVIIGTHRLVSADVQFKDLGLVIIDEEQRFGVDHKERLKQLRQTVDVLTLTATPIPRTLHMSLLGIRDISNLETPPRDRLAIETRIVRFDNTLIRHAMLRELNRDGQVYFVHNRVHNINAIADQIRSIVPAARVLVGHGQMNEHELEHAMLSFVRREADVLVATTIIESGLDIPNVNTIFINQADIYGLADLHQLRGRVGRYKHRAYAYLLLDPDRPLTPTASKRLKAIEEFTELGAGFKIAMRDLEIRGAGNILGTQQSGHIAAVGYEMYCQLLENAVRQAQNKPTRTPLEVNVELPWPAYLPRSYISGQRQKVEVYRRLSRIRRLERLQDFRQELRDRFGPFPEPVEWLLRLAELRLLAARWQVTSVHLEGSGVKREPGKPGRLVEVGQDGKAGTSAFLPTGTVDLVLVYRNGRRLKRLAARADGRLKIVDEVSAYFRLRPKESAPDALYAAIKYLLRLPGPEV
ncbi:MAG: transcription-repair coupling factor [Planctomycetes bacterium]|nr:transcription-repair coupling factor [Planctomycetota bacterium]